MRSPVPTTANEFLLTVYPIAEGIADIHAHGRVHRDIKRGNMKYDAEGCLKIFDFGMARNASVNASTLGLVGTRGYMAPELFDRGSDGRVSFTPAVDVFAFGATALALDSEGCRRTCFTYPHCFPRRTLISLLYR